jgi:predicted nucleic acid-binding protein
MNTLRHLARNLSEQGRLCISPPAIMEVVCGLKPPDTLEKFRQQVLPSFEIVPFSVVAACLAGEI